MLFTVQFPLFDLTPFASDAALPNRLIGWTDAEDVGKRFFPGFGVKRRRSSGTADYWIGETLFASGAGAMKFCDPDDFSIPGAAATFSVAFRRFFPNASGTSRFQVGLRVQLTPRVLAQNSLEILVERLLSTSVSSVHPYISKTVELGNFAGQLHGHYARVCAIKDDREAKRLIKAGAPVCVFEIPREMLGECLHGEALRRLNPRRRMGNRSASPDPCALYFQRLHFRQHEIPLWVIPSDATRRSEARLSRMAVQRIHAEAFAITTLCRQLTASELVYRPRTVSGDRIERFLLDTASFLDKDSHAGRAHLDLGRATFELDPVFDWEHLATTRSMLEGARRAVVRKLQQFEKTFNGESSMRHVTIVNNGGSLVYAERGDQTIAAPCAASRADLLCTVLNDIEKESAARDHRAAVMSAEERLALQSIESALREIRQCVLHNQPLKISKQGLIEAAATMEKILPRLAKTVGSLLPILFPA